MKASPEGRAGNPGINLGAPPRAEQVAKDPAQTVAVRDTSGSTKEKKHVIAARTRSSMTVAPPPDNSQQDNQPMVDPPDVTDTPSQTPDAAGVDNLEATETAPKGTADTLNRALTPMMNAFRTKIHEAGWLDRESTTTLQEGLILEDPTSQFETEPSLLTDNPDLFALHSSWITSGNTFHITPNLLFSAPVGEYGEEWARQLVSAGLKLAEASHSRDSDINMRAEAQMLNEAIPDPLNQATFRGAGNPVYDSASNHQVADQEKGAIDTFADSFQSIQLTAAQLTRYKVKGYEDDPLRLLNDLTAQGILSKYSLFIPPEENVFMAQIGAVFKNSIVEVGVDGKLRLNKDFIAYCKDKYTSDNPPQSATPKTLDKRGCPGGRKLPGANESCVDIGANIFADTVKRQRQDAQKGDAQDGLKVPPITDRMEGKTPTGMGSEEDKPVVEELRAVVASLTPKETDNIYLTKSAHLARSLLNGLVLVEYDAQRGLKQADIVARNLGDYALSTGNAELAERIFPLLSPSERWLFYAKAYDADALTITHLEKWRVDLDNNPETADDAKDGTVNAARLVALIQVELRNYSDTKSPHQKEEHQESLRVAEQYKNEFLEMTNPLNPKGKAKIGTPDAISADTKRKYKVLLQVAFTKAGLWNDARDFFQTWQGEDRDGIAMSKALSGKLSRSDLPNPKYDVHGKGKVLKWINDQRKGKSTEPPNADARLSYDARALLEAVAPELMGQLTGVKNTSLLNTLKMHIATDESSQALRAYGYIIDKAVFNKDTLPAALIMAADHESKKPDKKTSFQIETVQMDHALDLLVTGETANQFHVDAAGFARRLVQTADTFTNPEERTKQKEKVVLVLGEHAVATGNSQLADYIFSILSPANKWLLYASAHQHMFYPDQVSDWRIALGNTDASGRRVDQTVVTARLVALAEIALHNYTGKMTKYTLHGEDFDTLQNALDYKKKADAYKKAYIGLVNTPDASTLSANDNAFLTTRLSTSFARAGLWTQVGELTPKGEDPTIWREITAKILAGKLEDLELRMFIPKSRTRDVLEKIDAFRRGFITELPTFPGAAINQQAQQLLEEIAPDIAGKLGLEPTSDLNKLRIQLTTDGFRSAVATYHSLVQTPDLDLLRGALLLSEQQTNLDAVTPAHELFTEHFLMEITPVEGYIKEYLGKNEFDKGSVKASLDHAYKLFFVDEDSQLRDPKKKLLAAAQLSQLYRLAEINDQAEPIHLMTEVREQWTAFEQREGSADELIQLRDELKKLGFRFIKRWKMQGDQRDVGVLRYVGYEPIPATDGVLSNAESLKIANEGTSLHKSHIPLWVKAAEDLNDLLGEKRFDVKLPDSTDEPRDMRRLILQGTWPFYGTEYEIRNAIQFVYDRQPLTTAPELTERLDVIMATPRKSEPQLTIDRMDSEVAVQTEPEIQSSGEPQSRLEMIYSPGDELYTKIMQPSYPYSPNGENTGEAIEGGGFMDILGEPLGSGEKVNNRGTVTQLGIALRLSDHPKIDSILKEGGPEMIQKLRDAQVLSSMEILDIGSYAFPYFALAAIALGAKVHTVDSKELFGDLPFQPESHTVVNLRSPDAIKKIRETTGGRNFTLVTQSECLPLNGESMELGFFEKDQLRAIGEELLLDGGFYYGFNDDLYQKKPVAPATDRMNSEGSVGDLGETQPDSIGSKLPEYFPQLHRDFFTAILQGEPFTPTDEQIDAAVEEFFAFPSLSPITQEQEATLRDHLRSRYEQIFHNSNEYNTWQTLAQALQGDVYHIPPEGNHPMRQAANMLRQGFYYGEKAQELAALHGIEPLTKHEIEALLTDYLWYGEDAHVTNGKHSSPLISNGTRHLTIEQTEASGVDDVFVSDTYGFTKAQFNEMLSQIRKFQGVDSDATLRGLDLGGSNGLGAHDAEDLDPHLVMDNVTLHPDLAMWPLRGRHYMLTAERLPAEMAEQYDLILSNRATEYMRYPTLAVENAIWALQTGGILYLTDFTSPSKPQDANNEIEEAHRSLDAMFQFLEKLQEQGIITFLPQADEDFDAYKLWKNGRKDINASLFIQKTASMDSLENTPATAEKEPDPSDELNRVFTPLIRRFREKVHETGWLSLESTRIIDQDATMQIHPLSRLFYTAPKGMHSYAKFPDILFFCESWIMNQEKRSKIKDISNLNFRAPIGEYGERWAERMVNAAMKLAEASYLQTSTINTREEAEMLNNADPHINENLRDYTYRGADKFDGDDNLLKRGPIKTFTESFQSTLLAAGYLTMYQVPGYENDPDRLLKDLAEQGILSQLSLLINPTKTVHLAEHGAVFTNPIIERDEQGKFRLRRAIVDYFIQQREDPSALKDTGGAKPLERPGCPVGRKLPGEKESGVDISAKLFAETVGVQEREQNSEIAIYPLAD